MIKKSQKTIKINAQGQILGRLSTKIANSLRGKGNPSFEYNQLSNNKVIVYNVSKIIVTGNNKMKQKKYYRHSGYLGNLKEINYEKLFATNPKKVLIHSIKGMLPKNRLQKEFLKSLTIYNGDLND